MFGYDENQNKIANMQIQIFRKEEEIATLNQQMVKFQSNHEEDQQGL